MPAILTERKCEPCEGGVEPLATDAVRELMAALHADWKYDEARSLIFRHLEFPTFARTMGFANAIGWLSSVEGHHPQMTINYGSCDIQYRTTAIDGLSDNDFICAAKVDLLAKMEI